MLDTVGGWRVPRWREGDAGSVGGLRRVPASPLTLVPAWNLPLTLPASGVTLRRAPSLQGAPGRRHGRRWAGQMIFFY